MNDGGHLSVTAALADNSLSIAVADTGSGIDPVDLEKIFDPYYTTKAKGTGLGLAIVHKIVEGHGGQVLVESTPGAGTRFVLQIPCASETCRRKA